MEIEIDGAALDLSLAVLRLKSDLHDDWFPDPLRFADLLTPDAVAHQFSTPYSPQDPVEINVPKSGFTLRYSQEQSITDRIAYQAIVDSIEYLDKWLSPSVYGYRIRRGRGGQMFESRVKAWLDFNSAIRVRLKDRQGHLLATDVQNFYECIWHVELGADIERLGKTSLAQRNLLEKMLRKWSSYDRVALPQNRDASSFLANIYLQHIDADMLDKGYEYFRYMDDIRVVCKDRFEARRALMDLIDSLRYRHLNVNASKTAILDWANEKQLDNYIPVADREVEQFDIAVRSHLGADVRTIEILKRQTENFVRSGTFGERSFRACLDRLGRVANSFEGQHLDFTVVNDGIVSAIGDHPWLTDVMTSFLRHAKPAGRHIDTLTAILRETDKYIYSSQAY